MKITSQKLFAAILLLTIAAVPLHAQTNDTAEPETTNAVTSARQAPIATTNLEDEDARVDHTRSHVGGKNHLNVPIGPYRGNGNARGIIAILAVFGMPVAIVGMFFYFRHRKNKMLHETLRAMVEKGVPIPPELLREQDVDQPMSGQTGASSHLMRQRLDLRNGLILVAVGAGVTILAGKPGLIVLFIGIAMLISAMIERKRQSNQPPGN